MICENSFSKNCHLLKNVKKHLDLQNVVDQLFDFNTSMDFPTVKGDLKPKIMSEKGIAKQHRNNKQ